MAAPAYVNAGAGVTIASGSAACTLAGTTAGNTIILQVCQDGTAASAVTLSAITNLENLADTANALTVLAAAQPVGSPTSALQHLYIGRSLGGTVSVTVATTGDDLYYRLYEFTGAIAGTTLAAVTESIANGVGTGTTVSDTGVTTTGADRLPLQLVAINDDLAVGPFTGATGGTWLEAVAEFASATGTDGCIQLQIGASALIEQLAFTVSGVSFGSVGGNAAIALPFTPAANGTVGSVVAVLYTNLGTPVDDVTARIETDSAGSPSGTSVGEATVNVTGGTATTYTFRVAAPVTSGNQHWVVIRRSGAADSSNNYAIRVATSGVTGKTQAAAGTWSTSASAIAAAAFLDGMPSAGTINGGTLTMASGGWGVVGLALIPPVGGPATLERQAALAAVGLIASIGRELLARVAALNATAAVASSGIKVTPGVTYERAAVVAATGTVTAAGISIVPGRAAINATAGIAAVGRETLARTAAVAASAQIASAGREQLARLAELAAATNISVAGLVVSGAGEVERSAALAGSAGIATVGRELLPRAAVITATASISTVGQRRRLRSAAVSASAAVTAAGDILGAAQRSAQVAATGTVSATGAVMHVRSRSAAVAATAAVTTVPQRAVGRAATVTTVPTVTATGRLTLSRTAALGAVAAITTVAGGNTGQASLAAIATITVTLPLPAGAISTSTTGHVWAARRGGIHVGAHGDIAAGTEGQLARTGG